jgi:hypothetical protein
MKLKWMVIAATLTLLVFGASPVMAGTVCGDNDGDTVDDCEDNCSDSANPAQDDTDGDGCGNICDADYGQSGSANFSDFTAFVGAFLTVTPNIKLTEPVPGAAVNFSDFTSFVGGFLAPPGPSGTTSGTTACP